MTRFKISKIKDGDFDLLTNCSITSVDCWNFCYINLFSFNFDPDRLFNFYYYQRFWKQKWNNEVPKSVLTHCFDEVCHRFNKYRLGDGPKIGIVNSWPIKEFKISADFSDNTMKIGKSKFELEDKVDFETDLSIIYYQDGNWLIKIYEKDNSCEKGILYREFEEIFDSLLLTKYDKKDCLKYSDLEDLSRYGLGDKF